MVRWSLVGRPAVNNRRRQLFLQNPHLPLDRPIMPPHLARPGWFALFAFAASGPLPSVEPPTIRPFGPRAEARSDACPGSIKLSDKTIVRGRIYLTRDHRLKVYDETVQRHREIPLRVVRKIQCTVKREWMEKQWRFRENANDAKVFTGRTYPVREYIHTITLRDNREIQGPISAIIYLQREADEKRMRFLLHKRQKGKVGTDLKSLVYVQKVELGNQALEKSKRREGN